MIVSWQQLTCLPVCLLPCLQRWLNSYPNHMQGLPDSPYFTVDKLKAFNEHCAEVRAKHEYDYMKSKAKVVEVVAEVPRD